MKTKKDKIKSKSVSSKEEEPKSEKKSHKKKPALRDIELLVSKNSSTKEVFAQLPCLGLSAKGETRREAVWALRAKIVKYINECTSKEMQLVMMKPKEKEAAE